jgi:hypothetical protein
MLDLVAATLMKDVPAIATGPPGGENAGTAPGHAAPDLEIERQQPFTATGFSASMSPGGSLNCHTTRAAS